MGIGAELNSLIFWINAFIPDPSMSPFVIPAPGKPEGRSMIVVPAQLGNTPVPTFRSFLGDNRNFSDDVTAASRIHSLVEIADLDIFVPTFGAASMCGESIEIDGNSGVEIAKGTASTDRIRFLNLRGNTTVDPNGGVIQD